MNFNEKYFNYFDDKNIIEIGQLFSETMSIGQGLVFENIFKKLGINKVLKGIFYGKSDLINHYVVSM